MHTKDNKVLLCWIRFELVIRMLLLVDTVGQISRASNDRDICEAPKELEEPKSPRLLNRSYVGISSSEIWLKFALIEEDPRARSRTCKDGGR